MTIREKIRRVLEDNVKKMYLWELPNSIGKPTDAILSLIHQAIEEAKPKETENISIEPKETFTQRIARARYRAEAVSDYHDALINKFC